MTERPLLNLKSGARLTWAEDGKGGGVITTRTDVAPILEINKAMATHNDGYAPGRELRRVASIPFAIVHKVLVEQGYNLLDPANTDKLAAFLNDPDNAYLRTAPGRVGVSNGEMR